jgi:CRISPR-associated endonuclease Cas1
MTLKLETYNTGTIFPRHGVVTLFGYGIQARVDRGHLLLEDGIGSDRCRARLPRVGHGLKRLVVIGSDGVVSLAALRWLANQDAAFTMLDRDGSVLATTGPVCPSDARLRRAQALAIQSGSALEIARELIGQKLDGQAKVVREKLLDTTTAKAISELRARLATAESADAVRLLESMAGRAYWSAWRNLTVNFPKSDLRRVPDHWRTFGSRMSVLTGSPRLAVNPPNAILNYLYAVLESEARLAAAAVGLDPGLGVLHADGPVRDSLACDLMEPIRPKVDAYVLDWILHETLRRDWFFEQRNGNCRLMASFVARLSETAPIWGRAVAPFAEWVARTLSSNISKPNRHIGPATRLTQSHKRLARGTVLSTSTVKALRLVESVCRGCGKPIAHGRNNCAVCAVPVSRQNLIHVARVGRIAAQSAEAQSRRKESKCRHDSARSGWLPSSQPSWLNDETFTNEIQPRLGRVSVPAIASAIGVSLPYATDIRAGRRRPHPRHWQTLAQLAGVSADAEQAARCARKN